MLQSVVMSYILPRAYVQGIYRLFWSLDLVQSCLQSIDGDCIGVLGGIAASARQALNLLLHRCVEQKGVYLAHTLLQQQQQDQGASNNTSKIPLSDNNQQGKMKRSPYLQSVLFNTSSCSAHPGIQTLAQRLLLLQHTLEQTLENHLLVDTQIPRQPQNPSQPQIPRLWALLRAINAVHTEVQGRLKKEVNILHRLTQQGAHEYTLHLQALKQLPEVITPCMHPQCLACPCNAHSFDFGLFLPSRVWFLPQFYSVCYSILFVRAV